MRGLWGPKISLFANLVSVWCLFLEGTRAHGGDFRDFRDCA